MKLLFTILICLSITPIVFGACGSRSCGRSSARVIPRNREVVRMRSNVSLRRNRDFYILPLFGRW